MNQQTAVVPAPEATAQSPFTTVALVRYQPGRRPQAVLFFNDPALCYADRLEAALTCADALSDPATCPETHSYRVHLGI